MQWTNAHREILYRIIERRWSDLELDPWEEWLASHGIKWAELHHENDAPQGTVAVWEGPGIKDEQLKLCWVLPDDIAHKFIVLNFN
jgi:hypothetical protein